MRGQAFDPRLSRAAGGIEARKLGPPRIAFSRGATPSLFGHLQPVETRTLALTHFSLRENS